VLIKCADVYVKHEWAIGRWSREQAVVQQRSAFEWYRKYVDCAYHIHNSDSAFGSSSLWNVTVVQRRKNFTVGLAVLTRCWGVTDTDRRMDITRQRKVRAKELCRAEYSIFRRRTRTRRNKYCSWSMDAGSQYLIFNLCCNDVSHRFSIDVHSHSTVS